MEGFKFGDKVSHKKHGFGFIRALHPKHSTVVFENCGQVMIENCNLTKVSNLVPCHERMPELGVPVLVLGDSTAWVDKAYDFGDGVSFYDDNYGKATHWMPIPELAKEFSHEQLNHS